MKPTSLIILDKERTISASGNKILIYNKNKLLRTVPSLIIEDIIVHIENNLHENFLKLCSKNKIPVHFVNKNLRYYGTFCTGNSKNIFLREKQYYKRLDDDFVLDFSLRIVIGKRNSQLWVLRTLDKETGLPNINFEKIYSKSELLGIEGTIAQNYWFQFGKLIKNDDFNFIRRTKNPPRDEINSLLSYGYTLLVSKIITNILITGLDPYFGFYHELNYRRPSLALDFMEEFRPIAVDKFVLNLVNKRIITKNDFENYYGVMFLKKQAKGVFIKRWMDWWLKKEFYSKQFKKKLTLSELSMTQIKIFIKTLTGELKNYIPLDMKGSICAS